MLFLLDKDVRTVKWNGIPLHEASSAIVKEEINGDFYLTVRYPITDSGIYQLIKEDMLIKAPAPVLGYQLFRIKKPIENDDSLEITAYHISDDIMKRSITPVSLVGQGCAMALSQMVQNAKTDLGDFSFTSDIMDSRTFNTPETETLYSVLMDGKHSIVGTWEGELVRDNFALSIKRSRGADRGVVITTHKNLNSYQRTKNSQEVVTRIHARSTFKTDNAEDEVTLRVTVDSPLISSYPYINEKEYENNNAETVEDLRKWAEAKFTNEGIDKTSDAIEIEAYELDGQVVNLGDTVNIKSRKHRVDIYKKAIAYEFNCLANDGKGEYISITFDDKPGVGGSGVSSGVSSAADAILSANETAQEVAIQRAVKNANAAFDAEFDKRAEKIYDGIEQAKAAAEEYADKLKTEINREFDDFDREYQAIKQSQDQQIADILSQAESAQSLAEQAKAIGDQAKADAVSLVSQLNTAKTTLQNSINDTKLQIATVSQALNTAKSDLQAQVTAIDTKAMLVQVWANQLRTDIEQQGQTILSQAQAQNTLTNRITAVESLADGTKTTITELSKTVNKTTGDIASVSSRTKTVEDTLVQNRTKYEALTQTIDSQTGQIDSINRKTADLQSGLDSVSERFESLQIGSTNHFLNSDFENGLGAIWQSMNIYSLSIDNQVTLDGTKSLKVVCSDGSSVNNPKVTYPATAKLKTVQSGRLPDVVTISFFAKTETDGMILRSRLGYIDYTSDTDVSLSTDWKRYAVKIKTTTNATNEWIFRSNKAGIIWIAKPQFEFSATVSDYSKAEEDFSNQIAEYKRTADQNYSGLQSTVQTLDGKITQNKSEVNQTATQLSNRLTSLETYKNAEGTRAQAYFEASKTETAKQITAERTAITQNYVAKSTYTEDYNGTTRRLTATETVANRADTTANSAVTKATSAQTTADTAKTNAATVTAKLATYQETNDRRVAALETAKSSTDGTLTQLSNKVEQNAQQTRETISAVEAKMPTKVSGRNLATGSSDQWNNFITISSNNNWSAKLATVLYGDSTGIYADTTINIFVYLSADDIVLDSTVNPRFIIHGAVIDKQNNVTWTDWDKYNPFFNKWSTNLVAGNNYRVVKLSSKVTAESYANIKGFELAVRIDGVKSGKFHWRALMITTGDIFPDYWEKPIEDLVTEISNAKLDITKTADGLKLTANKVEGHDKSLTQHTTQITALNNELSAKVSKTDYDKLTGRMTNAETAIQVQAGEISKRLTSTQVEETITAKGYQTKAQVDSNITGRGYITNSALQPYATLAVLENKVSETSSSFERRITETKALIPTEQSAGNMLKASNVGVGPVHSSFLELALPIEKGKEYTLVQHWWRGSEASHSNGSPQLAIDAGMTVENKGYYDAVLKYDSKIDSWFCTFTSPVTVKAGTRIRFANTDIKSKRSDGVDGTGYWSFTTLVRGSLPLSVWQPAFSELATVTAFNSVKDTVDAHKRIIGDGSNISSAIQSAKKFEQQIASGGEIYQAIATAKGLVTTVSGTNGLSTQVSQLKESWSFKTLNGAGDIISQANLASNQFLLEAAKIRLKGKTLADEIQAIDGKFNKLFVADGTFSKLNADIIDVQAITGSKIKFDQSFFNNLMANDAYLKQLFAKNAFITQVQSVTIAGSQIVAGSITADKLAANAIDVGKITGNVANFVTNAVNKDTTRTLNITNEYISAINKNSSTINEIRIYPSTIHFLNEKSNGILNSPSIASIYDKIAISKLVIGNVNGSSLDKEATSIDRNVISYGGSMLKIRRRSYAEANSSSTLNLIISEDPYDKNKMVVFPSKGDISNPNYNLGNKGYLQFNHDGSIELKVKNVYYTGELKKVTSF